MSFLADSERKHCLSLQYQLPVQIAKPGLFRVISHDLVPFVILRPHRKARFRGDPEQQDFRRHAPESSGIPAKAYAECMLIVTAVRG